MYGNRCSVAIWVPLLHWHVVYQAEQGIGERWAVGQSFHLKWEETTDDMPADVWCVGQDHEAICKHGCIGGRRE